MQRIASLATCWAWIVCAVSCAAADPESAERGIAFGTIVEGRLISFVEEGPHRGSGLTWYYGDLSTSRVRTLESLIPRKAHKMADMLSSTGCFFFSAPFGPHRWRIHEGYLWAMFLRCSSAAEGRVIMRMAFCERLADEQDVRTAQDSMDSHDETKWASGSVEGHEDKWRERTIHLWPPESRQDLQVISEEGLEHLSWKAHSTQNHPSGLFECDIMPIGPRALLVLVIMGEKLELWQYDFWPVKWKTAPSWIKNGADKDVWLGMWTRQAEFSIHVKEPFHAVRIPEGVAIVTDSGRSYVAMMNPQRCGSSGLVWGDELRPLIAMVDVPEQGRCYAFGKDFYFALSDHPMPKQCRDVTRHPADHGEPLRTSWECAKVLHENGELEAPAEQCDP